MDWKQRLVDIVGAGWLAIGAGLVTAPGPTMRLAGLEVEGSRAEIVSRILGLRDLALGTAVLSASDADTRRPILRGVAAMDFLEVGMMLTQARRVPAGMVMRLVAAAGLNGAVALAASQAQDEGRSEGAPLLAAGYLLAMAPALDLFGFLRRRDERAFIRFMSGTALVTAAWWRRGNRGGVAMNAGALAGAATLWAALKRRDRRRLRGEPAASS